MEDSIKRLETWWCDRPVGRAIHEGEKFTIKKITPNGVLIVEDSGAETFRISLGSFEKKRFNLRANAVVQVDDITHSGFYVVEATQ